MAHLLRLLRGFKYFSRVKEVFKAASMTKSWPELTLAYLHLKKLNYPYYLKFSQGITIELNSWHDTATAWVIFFREEYKVPQDSQIIIDAGANIGCFSIYAAMKAPGAKIYALEPFPETYEKFKRNITANHLDSRVELIPIALSDHDGVESMGADMTVPSQSRGLVSKKDPHALEVEAMTVQSFFIKYGLNEVDFFKMDIEGAEHQALPAVPEDIFARVKKFSLEFHPNGKREQLFKILENHRFNADHVFQSSEDSGVAWFSKAS